ncbi:MAG: hypothetical protein GPOALKHO_000314 [Sodalis sp.]|nr:MAG: hypothetical protein GPOALKHO_000314 [Sodalis sp.]
MYSEGHESRAQALALWLHSAIDRRVVLSGEPRLSHASRFTGVVELTDAIRFDAIRLIGASYVAAFRHVDPNTLAAILAHAEAPVLPCAVSTIPSPRSAVAPAPALHHPIGSTCMLGMPPSGISGVRMKTRLIRKCIVQVRDHLF